MLSAETCLRSVPTAAVEEYPPCVTSPLFEMGTPSTMMLEPKALVLLYDKLRNCNGVRTVRSAFPINCPGTNCITSAKLVAWRWSMACRPMIEAVEAPATFCLAVTTTSFNANDVGVSCSRRSRSFVTSTCVLSSSKPT